MIAVNGSGVFNRKEPWSVKAVVALYPAPDLVYDLAAIGELYSRRAVASHPVGNNGTEVVDQGRPAGQAAQLQAAAAGGRAGV